MTEFAPYAVTSQQSRGRKYPEPPNPYRGAFERDRERIVSSAAFRRLEGKTQVFTPGLNDQYRTRLTHTIEVTQTGRTIACVLGLNEYLTEAICLGHDIGHSPFGHTGEAALNHLLRDQGGFEHNRQALRIVEFIEHPYPGFPGLNLTWETRQGLAKHRDECGFPVSGHEAVFRQVSLEGQVADLADRITYNTHDLEDGIRARIIEEPQVSGLDLLDAAREKIGADAIEDFVIRRTQLAKAMLDLLMADAIETSRENLAREGVRSPEDVYRHSSPLITLSRQADEKLLQLEKYLREHMYLHSNLDGVRLEVERWLAKLFGHLCENPSRMPTYYNGMIESQGLERTVCDYIAGMTDRFAMRLVNEIS